MSVPESGVASTPPDAGVALRLMPDTSIDHCQRSPNGRDSDSVYVSDSAVRSLASCSTSALE